MIGKLQKNDTKRNRKSNELHQLGEDSQQAEEQDLAKNKKGVAMQCIMHNVLAIIPILSVVNVVVVIIEVHLCNNVAKLVIIFETATWLHKYLT